MTDPTDDDARDMVRELAARGGDPAAVQALLVELLLEHAEHRAELLTLTLRALRIVFAECLPGPATTPRPPAATATGPTEGRNHP